MKKERAVVLTKYVAAFAVMGIMTLLVLIGRETLEKETAADVIKDLADAFTVSSLISLSVGALLFVSTRGFFDMISYSLGEIKGLLIPLYRRKHRDESFFDYRNRKNGERISEYGFIIITGAIYLVIGLIFTVFYYV